MSAATKHCNRCNGDFPATEFVGDYHDPPTHDRRDGTPVVLIGQIHTVVNSTDGSMLFTKGKTIKIPGIPTVVGSVGSTRRRRPLKR